MEKNEEEEKEKSSLFPLLAVSSAATTTTTTTSPNTISPPINEPGGWLRNASFTTDLSVINDAVSSLHRDQTTLITTADSDHVNDDDFDSYQQRTRPAAPSTSYELVSEEEENEMYAGSDSVSSDSDEETKKRKKRRKKKKRNKRKRSRDEDTDFTSRKSNVRAWADSDMKPPKDYYFDTHGDRDNLVYGSLYRMDVPRYKPYNPTKLSGFDFQGLCWSNRRGFSSIFDRDVDIDSLDIKLKSAGRYWSAKYVAVERHKNLKRLHLLGTKQSSAIVLDDFVPLSDIQMNQEAVDHGLVSKASAVEESWEDEVLRKTREFNKITREHSHDEKAWLDFAEFQDKVASMQPQKRARLQTLEKKISILEKATELNPDNEELLLHLLKAYQSRDSIDVLNSRWEKVLMCHSNSYKLWKEYLHFVQGEFSRFKVSEMRKMYAHAIQALSTACSKQFREVCQNSKPSSLDPAMVQLELGLVDIFLSLCRLEWQAGYRELATALFQAQIEFSLFCPSLLLTKQGKLRLFEHFWNSDGLRVGEEGALGWSTWLEKEEENRQRIVKEETSDDNDRGGWTGWSEPLSKHEEIDKNLENVTNNDVADKEFEEEFENEDIKQDEDDTESLLKQLGIDVNAGADSEVKDTSTWARWSEEESSRDHNQWMPIHGKSDRISQSDGTPDREADEQFLRVILFEDVSEYLFSLSTTEARLSLVSQFIEFFGGEMSQW